MYRKHHTKGIVVGNRIEGDSNKYIDLFSENFGLVSARVQGARNLHSKLRGGSQDFSLGEFSLVHGKNGWRLVSARTEKNFFEIFRNSPNKLKIVCNILNLIKKLISEEETKHSYNSVFNIISNFFDFLIKADEEDIVLSECLTLIRILHVLGYMRHDPELSIPISSAEIEIKKLINESLKATNLT
ncbi:MAG: repair protein RecO protein [Candidatus Woesebacteria bacterium GW2011_GWA1_39_8]|uniref:Repair protein RecO protein n=1 Tax=Candidatus Woesebacteria bacterium GW2011_GWA1_39_8 TaxID=1618552 RepID=A0A0G0S0P0_9BACT|nr:MAG: repair protein RecO protein [Candidatus Woesebacteria bacterium GW2011_GWA1_39_8]